MRPNDPSLVSIDQSNSNGVRAICALDGSAILCWGYNAYGEAGQGAASASVQNPMPVLIGASTPLSGVTDLTPGNVAFCARRTDASLWCWGYGYTAFATKYGATNVVGAGTANGAGLENGPRYLTGDGVYRAATTSLTPTCL